MTRSAADVKRVALLLETGLSQAEVARRTGIPRPTVCMWAGDGVESTLLKRRVSHWHDPQRVCEHVEQLPGPAYSYLLGLYLGDGCLTSMARGVYRLRVALDSRYPSIIAECEAAMADVLPNRVAVIPCRGCVHVSSYSKHWPCLFPQHGPGRKHLRPIALEPWQEGLALDANPQRLLRGLVHSDGYRGMNRVKGGYEYPRYLFSNRSGDILGIFTEACRRVASRPSRPGHGACRSPAGPTSLSWTPSSGPNP
jgi:hypothetical protein